MGSAPDQQYDAFGNITYKAGVGAYIYMNDRPRTLQSTGDGVSYSYDATGNMLSDTGGRNLYYTVFEKPALIMKTDSAVFFSYDAARALYTRTDFDGAAGTATYTFEWNLQSGLLLLPGGSSYPLTQ